MKRSACAKLLASVLLVSGPTLSSAACVSVVGTVKLTADATCRINTLGSGTPAFQNQCFSVALNILGFPAASGYAGVTAEPLAGLGGTTATPAAVIDVATQQPRQSVQTARSAVSIGQGGYKTTLYTNDVIVAQVKPNADGSLGYGAVTEQILITGSDGKGAYAKVTGNLTVLGNSIGAPANVVGKLCLP